MTLVDLDAELIRIRDLRSRMYFGDALKAYRAGAFRAAIASTWVAVAYDLIRKYRELEGLGDQEAHAFLEKVGCIGTGKHRSETIGVGKIVTGSCPPEDGNHRYDGIANAKAPV